MHHAKLVGRDAADITKTGEVIGTPGYMSPEQLRGRADIGPATDLYALGLLLYLMIEGRPPFLGDTPLAIGMAHLTEHAPPLTRGPAPLRELVARLLAKAPEDRPPTARAVATVLGRLQGVPATPPTSIESNAIPPAIWIGAGIVAAILIGLVFVGLDAPDDNSPPEVAPPAPARPPTRDIRPVEPATAPVNLGTPLPSEGSAGCFSPPVPGGKLYANVPVSALDARPVLHHLPKAYDGKTPMPLVVLFHRKSQTAAEILDETEFTTVADEHGFVVAAPQSRVGSDRVPWLKDDYLVAAGDIAALENARCIDTSRVYLVALASGISGASKLVCDEPDRYAAMTASGVRFTPSWKSCFFEDGIPPIPYLEFTDLHDAEKPPAGGEPTADCPGKGPVWSLDRHRDAHRKLHGCTNETSPSNLDAAKMECTTWTCQTPYVACAIEGGRFWADRPRNQALAPCYGSAVDVPRASLAWQFLSRYRSGLDQSPTPTPRR